MEGVPKIKKSIMNGRFSKQMFLDQPGIITRQLILTCFDDS
jgi:hypothetical protein